MSEPIEYCDLKHRVVVRVYEPGGTPEDVRHIAYVPKYDGRRFTPKDDPMLFIENNVLG